MTDYYSEPNDQVDIGVEQNGAKLFDFEYWSLVNWVTPAMQ